MKIEIKILNKNWIKNESLWLSREYNWYLPYTIVKKLDGIQGSTKSVLAWEDTGIWGRRQLLSQTEGNCKPYSRFMKQP